MRTMGVRVPPGVPSMTYKFDRVRAEKAPKLPSYKLPSWAPQAQYPSASGKGDTSKKERPEYTGSYVIGVATMHKSNTVPVTSQQAAIDIAKMRR